MDVVNFDALKAQGRILDLANVDPEEDYLIIGKYSNDYTTNSFKYTKYPIYAIKAGDVIGVQSVTGLDTDNTDPLNPVVNIAVDGTTITGQGTPASPLVAVDPRPYKVYTALLTQNGTNSPVATVLENTIGNIVWTRVGPGDYLGTLANAFNNTTFFICSQTASTGSRIYFDGNFGLIFNQNQVSLCYRDSLSFGIDNFGGPVSIEIRVYN